MAMLKRLLNPYEYWPEKKLLIIGLAGAVAGSLVAVPFNARFDGALDLHFVERIGIVRSFADNTVSVFSLFVPLYLYGWTINRKTRAVDILNAILIARIPYYVLPLLNIQNVVLRSSSALVANTLNGEPITVWAVAVSILFAVFAIAALAVMIVLLYKGFRTATNSKTLVHKILFAACVVIAEVLSKILLRYLVL